MTVASLSEDDKQRLVEGYQIISSSNGDNHAVDQHALKDIVHLCFHDNAALLPQLQAYMDEHKTEFLKHDKGDDTAFDEMVARFKAFQDKYGHQQVSEDQDRTLCWWIQWQKHLMHQYKLPVKHQMKLLKVNFDFRGGDDDWDNNMYGWDTRRAT